MIYVINHFKVFTKKHFLVVVVLYSMADVIQSCVAFEKFEHCLFYDKTCEIEIFIAE